MGNKVTEAIAHTPHPPAHRPPKREPDGPDRQTAHRGCNGGRSPLANARAVYRAWLATAYNALAPLQGTAFSARYSGYFPESIRNTLPPSAPRYSTESSAARASNHGTITAAIVPSRTSRRPPYSPPRGAFRWPRNPPSDTVLGG